VRSVAAALVVGESKNLAFWLEQNFCKYIATASAESAEVRDMAGTEDRSTPQPRRLVGVRGWLLLFCLVLVIVQPIGFFVWLQSLLEVWPVTGRPLNLVVGLALDALCGAVVAGYAIWIAYRLWSIRPNAVIEAKTYLFAQAALAAVSPLILTAIAGFPLDSPLVNDEARGFAQAASYATVWLLYFTYSRRVGDTYGVKTSELKLWSRR
jgi:hypothetical protein